MRLRPTLAAAGVLAAAVALTVVLPTAASAGDPRRPVGACAYRACVLLSDLVFDSDGDGYADIDEQRLGTDPHDPASHPKAVQLIDLFVRQDLPSFVERQTAMVVIPQTTPDGQALTTGLARYTLVPGQKGAFGTTQDLLDLFDLSGLGVLPDILASIQGQAPVGQSDELPWVGAAGFVYYHPEWYSDSDGGSSGGGKTWTSGKGIYQTTYSDSGPVTFKNPDGSKDVASTSTKSWNDSFSGNPHSESTTVVTSTDKNGKQTGSRITETSSSRDPKTGESSKSTTVTTTTRDPKTGKVTGQTETKTTTEVKNETKTTTTTTTTTDADGKVVNEETKTETTSCPKNKCTGMVDPDYVATNTPLTPQQIAQVNARLNSVKTPGPDTGLVPVVDPAAARDRWKPYMLFGADGVAVLSNDGRPNFHTGAVDYDPTLVELATLGGTVPPKQNPDGTTSWTDGDGTYWP